MLGKLIKYELKATRKFMFLLYGLLLAISVLTSLMFHFNVNGGDFNVGTKWGSVSFGGGAVLEILAVLLIIAYVVLTVAAVSAMFFYAIMRFRKNLLGDEGYLMHTLPVKERDHILSKSIVSVLWTLAGFAAAVISGVIILCGAAGSELFAQLYKLFSDVDGMFLLQSGRVILLCIELVILVIFALACGYLHIYASMAVGYSLDKYRAVVSVGAFLLLDMLETVLHGVTAKMLLQTTHAFYQGHGHLVLWIEIMFAAIMGLAYYGITKYFLSRRLNLE